MTSHGFLAHLFDPFSIDPPFIVFAENDSTPREVQLKEVSGSALAVVTYDAHRVVDSFRKHSYKLPHTLIDVRTALRLLSGRPRDEGGEQDWDVLTLISEFLPDQFDRHQFRRLIEGRSRPSDRGECLRLLSAAASALNRLWTEISLRLSERNEARRFSEIEIPIQQVFHTRQFSGLAINLDSLGNCIEAAKLDKYSAFRELAAMIGSSPSGLNYRNVGDILPTTDAAHLGEFATQSNLESYFELAKGSSRFAAAFLKYQRADRSLGVLTRLQNGSDRIFPVFDCIGTVTARIAVIEPRLQELRRAYRSVISADPGKHLAYLDYAQFEPGIMASLAQDTDLIAAYNSTDLYEALSLQVFEVPHHRRLCKSIFLAYCYGMSIQNIAKLLSGADFSLETLTRNHTLVSTFFARFRGLERFRNTCWHSLEENGFVESLMGNRRVRSGGGPLNSKERRWAVNQAIQGTASLIFKTAITDVVDELGHDAILLPMHDAMLVQFDPIKNKNDRFQKIVISKMKAAFKKWCPNVQPKVVQTPFAASDLPTSPPQAEEAQLTLPFLR